MIWTQEAQRKHLCVQHYQNITLFKALLVAQYGEIISFPDFRTRKSIKSRNELTPENKGFHILKCDVSL